MFGEGTDRENNKKSHFPATEGSALDNGGHMNNARQLSTFCTYYKEKKINGWIGKAIY